MTGFRPPAGLVMGFHPTARGFGWVVFEGPFTPFDWGLVSARTDKNAVCLRRLEQLLERFRPEVLVLEAYDRHTSKRARRIAGLCEAARRTADARGVEVAIYTLGEIRAAFAEAGAVTRHEISEVVARHLEVLRHRLPPRRKAWESEDHRSGLFAAAAVVLSYHRKV